MGRRPKLKSDEFSKSNPIVIKIISILVEIERRLCVHLLGFGVRNKTIRARMGVHVNMHANVRTYV